ncbi:hypothetical protein DFQ28_007354 [Apophysomyces sp. BC1034]|nr:hypothetical protein DFQ30_002476 [Apophysomyces sp. BC1015]KAG0181386.1 hypothetical protein DFQ29_008443 [Apophysomyces sp. BC1021]KAG0192881.1 hypothetical protein DFQ28_007354 [Apophysomyces sp. BC1034]
MTTTTEIHSVIQILQQEVEHAQNENLNLQDLIEQNKNHQRELTNDNDYLRKKIAAIQQDNATYSNTQARLETQLYAQEQDMGRLRKEIQQLTKSRKDTEKRLASELQNFENDKSSWVQREVDLYNQIRTLSMNSEPRTPRTPRRRSVTATTMNSSTMSPFTSYTLGDIGENEQDQENDHAQPGLVSPKLTVPKLASIDSSYAREAKIAQRTIKAQDKLIADLKKEMEQHKSALQDQNGDAQRQSLRIEHLEHEIANVKQLNRSLMEDNESYQILLHEKTISGEFMMNPIMQVEQEGPSGEDKRRSLKPSTSTSSGGLNLAAELNLASIGTPDWEASQKADETELAIQKLNDEIKMLQDTNRALQLYMNKILMRIINNKQLEDVLSIDQPKPKAPETTENEQSSTKVNAGPGPAPTRTLSSTLMGKATTARQRRRTISYWGANKAAAPAVPDTTNDDKKLSVAEDRNTRRHSSIASSKEPEKQVNGGWAKALRRMSVIGWSKPAEETDTTHGSSSEDTEHSSSESVRRRDVDTLSPSMSRSGSSTTTSSLRRSNELATLQEE